MDPSPATPALEAGPPATPLWVKLIGAGILALVLLFVALHLAGGAPTGH
jgi:hypothetical protein